MPAATIAYLKNGWAPCPGVVILSYLDCSVPNLPTTNPHVHGQLWKSGSLLLVSTG